MALLDQLGGGPTNQGSSNYLNQLIQGLPQLTNAQQAGENNLFYQQQPQYSAYAGIPQGASYYDANGNLLFQPQGNDQYSPYSGLSNYVASLLYNNQAPPSNWNQASVTNVGRGGQAASPNISGSTVNMPGYNITANSPYLQTTTAGDNGVTTKAPLFDPNSTGGILNGLNAGYTAANSIPNGRGNLGGTQYSGGSIFGAANAQPNSNQISFNYQPTAGTYNVAPQPDQNLTAGDILLHDISSVIPFAFGGPIGGALSIAQQAASGDNQLDNKPSFLGVAKQAGISAAGSYAGNAVSDQFPETMNSVNPFSDSTSNVSPSGEGDNWNPSQGDSSNIPPSNNSGLSSPASSSTLGSPSSSANFGPSSLNSPSPFSSTGSPLTSSDPLSTLSGPGTVPSGNDITWTSAAVPGGTGANVSGAAQPSIFDNLANGNFSDAASGVGQYAMDYPLQTGLGIAGAAGAANRLGLFGSGNSSSDVGGSGGSAPSLLAPPFNPSEQSQAQMPGSLSQYSGLDPFQQATNIATQGVYGRGNGPQENSYFLNLINRQLYDQGGNLANDNSSINPIENSYLSQLGITGQNPTDILKGINQYGM